MPRLVVDHASRFPAHWNRHLQGTGALEESDGTVRFLNVDTTSLQYSNAQIDDYQGLHRGRLPWRPPLTLAVRARFSAPEGSLKGTAGFGFWNDPFLMTEWRVPTLPRAVWFFYASPRSDIKLARNVPGHGWKAATVDALRPVSLMLALLAIPAVLAMNLSPLYRLLWPPIQNALRIREAPLDVAMTDWHSYVMEWGVERSCFFVDDRPVIENAPSPLGPLGFVMWLDNQYMVVKPWGRFDWGLLEAPGPQWLEVDRLAIETPSAA